jgi:hypothetical protein
LGSLFEITSFEDYRALLNGDMRWISAKRAVSKVDITYWILRHNFRLCLRCRVTPIALPLGEFDLILNILDNVV